MTRDDLNLKLAECLQIKYAAVTKYVKLSKAAASNDLNGTAQILKDIAKEEYIHTNHLENILKEVDNFEETAELRELRENAKTAIDTI